MGMSESYGEGDRDESLATIARAIDTGVTFLDTADIYGPHTNEQLVGEAIRARRDQVGLATKFGIVRDANYPERRGVNGRPEYVHAACDASLARLGLEYIDLYYQHRVDPNVPIEETVGAMAELITAGKVRYLGLSEAGPATIKRAHVEHPITALQSEWSLWSRDIEREVVGVARELGIGIVAYSPLGRGFLTGQIRTPGDFGDDDFRKYLPRFQGENFVRNLELVDQVTAMAEEKGVSAGQLALAWVHAHGEDVFPIPGTKRRSYLDENAAAFDVRLDASDLARLDEIMPADAVAGDRYPDMRFVGVEAREATEATT